MIKPELETLANELLLSRDQSRISQTPQNTAVHISLEKAYEVGQILHESLMSRGFRPAGRKIGFTNPATWEEYKVDMPIWASTYEQTNHFAERGKFILNMGKLVAPRIEPEIMFKLSREFPKDGHSTEKIVSCLEWAAIGFEIVDCHYPEWRCSASGAVADFGLHAGLVIGEPWLLRDLDPGMVASQLRDLRVNLSVNGKFMDEGEGKNALGSPLLALGWLDKLLKSQSWATKIRAGEIITTGTLTKVPFVHSGERWAVTVSGAPLGALELELHD